MKRKAIIFGIRGSKLTNDEKRLIKFHKPWGIILFSRNIKNLNQAKLLIKNIRSIIKDKKYPILIDQEGGRVGRLNNLIDTTIFSQEFFGNIYIKNKNKFFNYYKTYVNSVCNIFNEIGINVNTVPVLDVKKNKSHKIIGDRSFSKNSEIVSKLGKICTSLYHEKKIGTVIKHIPGHGSSKFDTHQKVSSINSKKNELIKNDFKAFKNSKSFFAMTAHLIYKSYDPLFAATHSNIIIKKIIRKYIGFKGIIISDDISMKALKYNLKDNATKALNAGCNLVLHCNANINEMKLLAKIIPSIDKFTQKKTSQFYKFLG